MASSAKLYGVRQQHAVGLTDASNVRNRGDLVTVSPEPSGRAATTKILLDLPTTQPALGFREIGAALAHLVSYSEPHFAIGIFGGWGSGKTTLMAAIKAALPSNTLVIVDFNAWRFEREPQLLLPLLDTIRAALIEWS